MTDYDFPGDDPQNPASRQRIYLRTAPDIANRLLGRIRRSHQEGYRLVQIGVPEIDRALTIYPGSVTALVGRPGMGKSMLCKAMARAELDRIRRDGTGDSECVVYVTLEEPEEKLAVQIGRLPFAWRDVMRGTLGDQAEAERAAVGVAKTLRNLYVVAQVGSVNGKRVPPLTTGQIYDTIEAIQSDYGMRPTLVVLDYLQLIQGDQIRTERKKTEMVMAASAGAVRIARALEAPVIMAVQASRDTDTNSPPIPKLRDMQWASAIEQDVDIALGLCRPAATSEIQDAIAKKGFAEVVVGGRELTVTDSLMIVSPSKARDDGGAGKRYALHLDPVTLEVSAVAWGAQE